MKSWAKTVKPRRFLVDKVANRNLLPLALIIIFGIFASTILKHQPLGKLPLQ